MAGNYTPRPGSLAAHACAWFKANPSRKLTLAAICGRWGGTSQTATAQLGAAEDAEFLLSERIGRNDVYSAGPGLAKWTPLNDSLAEAHSFNPAEGEPAAPVTRGVVTPTSTLQAKPEATTPTKRAPRKPLPPLDIASIQVKTGTLLEPVRGGPHRAGQSQYTELFLKLDTPNSYVEVPSTYVGTLNKALMRYRKEQPHLVLRMVKSSDKTHQLQRLADKTATNSTKA